MPGLFQHFHIRKTVRNQITINQQFSGRSILLFYRHLRGPDRAINLEKISDLMEFFHDFIKDRDMFLGEKISLGDSFLGDVEYLKIYGWNMIVSFLDGLFSGAMLVSGSVGDTMA